MDAFKLLTEDAWLHVFKMVEDPTDKLNLVRTSSYLEGCLGKNRDIWLFPQIVSILLNEFEEKSRYQPDYQFRMEGRDRKRSLLKCRSFSKSFLEVFEKFEEEYWSKFYKSPFIFGRDLTLLTKTKLLTFLGQIKNHPETRNPILNRSLIHWFESGEPSAVSTEDLGYIREVFCLTPNLRCFHLMIDDPMAYLKLIRTYNYKENVNVQFPDWPQLQSLHIQIAQINADLQNVPLSFRIQQYFEGNLVDLELPFFLWKEQYNKPGTFPLLETLTLGNINISKDFQNVLDLLEFVNIPILKEIQFSFSSKNISKQNRKLVEFRKKAVKILKRRYPNCSWGHRETFNSLKLVSF